MYNGASPLNSVSSGVLVAPGLTADRSEPALRSAFHVASIHSTARSTYHSLQASLTRRFSKGLQFLASYTFSKSIDNGSGSGGGAGTGGIVNPNAPSDTSMVLGKQLDNRANRGVSDFDRTHRLVFSYLWDLPRPTFATSSRAGSLLLSGWQLSGIVTG